MKINQIYSRLKNLYYSQKYDLYLIILIVISFILKFVNLGYSDFQGDEIKALFILPSNTSVWTFLLTQRKGPMQFFVTFLIKLADPQYINQFLARIPFAIAGFFAVIYFYKLLKLHFTRRAAFFASFLIATNGFFVAFGRIAQYQSLDILFSILCLYYVSLSVTEQKYKKSGMVLGFVFWALSILSHYDGGFILPVVTTLVVLWLKKADLTAKSKVFTLLVTGLISGIMLAVFYVPFVILLSKSTLDYWQGRLSGNVSSKLSSSRYLFTVYQPIYMIHFYIILTVAFIVIFGLTLLKPLIVKLFNKVRLLRKPLAFFSFLTESFSKRYSSAKILVTLLWFLIGYIFWETIVYIPGTHIYTYLMPLIILIGITLDFLVYLWDELYKKANFLSLVIVKNIAIFIVFCFIFLQSYAIFVDNTEEYPWQQEKFLIWTFSRPTASYHLSMFGFPYFRDWEGISRFVKSHKDVTAYSTNERESISRYFIPLEKDSDKAGFYIYIRYPQSFTDSILSDKALYWANKYPPVYTMSKNGEDIVSIYKMPIGTLDEIKAEGY